MKPFSDPRSALVVSGSIVLLFLGAAAASCVTASTSTTTPVTAQRPERIVTDSPHLIVGYARKHPDKAVSGAFADKLERGEIRIVIEKPKEHAMASFGRREGTYVLTVDPDRLKPDPTQDEYEDVLAILSHEHAHYRQYVEDEMTNYHRRHDGRMSETGCTFTILVEIDAHAKTCRDAKAYGWTSSAAKHACASTSASIAGYFIKERLASYPECKAVWSDFAGPPPKVSKPKPARRSAERKTTGAIYMPPP
jgi:hypothetical protein